MSPRVDYAAVVDRLVDVIKELNEPCAAATVSAAAAFAEHSATADNLNAQTEYRRRVKAKGG